jgi:hypothetical protein
MKRQYKIGDWFCVPLSGEHDAIGIITHACRSRLFGYFFPVDAGRVPSFEELKRLRASDSVACALFGGAGLEQARWTPLATSLPFDPAAWPFPQFASRGVFGRTWWRIIYDPETMSILQRETSAAAQALELPDARFATPEELESLLQLRIACETPETPLVVCEVRSPIDLAQLQPLLSRGGRIQFSEPLDSHDVERLAAFVHVHPDVELRVHGFSRFDLRVLGKFAHLRSLVLDARTLEHLEALEALQQLESLRLGDLDEPAPLDVLQQLPALRRLEVHGMRTDVRAVARLKRLDALGLVDTPPLEWLHFECAEHLRSLLIAHVQCAIGPFPHLPMLERLSLRDLQLAALPDLSRCPRLHAVELRNITLLTDLSSLCSAPALRELRVEGLPQLNVSDFGPLRASLNLQNVTIEIGSKTKAREAYRLLRAHKITEKRRA